MPRRLAVSMALIDKRDNTRSQFYWMWLAICNPISAPKAGNHITANLGILNLKGRDKL
jgi:hypothetical protein